MTSTLPSRIARWMIWIIAGLLSIDIYTLTGAAATAVVVLVVGLFVGTAVGRLTASRSGESMNMAVSVVAGVALVVLVSSVWAIANVEPPSDPDSGSDSDGPPPLEAVVTDAEVYQAALAEGDFEAYRYAVGPKLVLGVALEETFAIERGCLDWTAVAVSVAPHLVSPFLAEVTFSAGDREMVRTFQYLAGRWVVTVDANC